MRQKCLTHFLAPFLPNIALISVFAVQMALLGFLSRFLSFKSPVTSHLVPGFLQAIRRERERERGEAAGVPKRIGLLTIFSELKKSFVASGFDPWPLCDRRALYPFCGLAKLIFFEAFV